MRQFKTEKQLKYWKSLEGKKQSKEHIDKRVNAIRGRKRPDMISQNKLVHTGTHKSYEARIKMSLAKLGKNLTDDHKKHISESNKGKHFKSVEDRKIISLANKGRVVSEQQRLQVSKAFKGRKLSDEHKQRISEGLKRSYFSGNRIATNKGKHLSDETKLKISTALKGVEKSEGFGHKLSIVNIGKHHTKETKLKLSLSHMNPSEEVRANIRRARAKQVFPLKDTSIEVIVQKHFESLGMVKYVDYIPHFPLRIKDGTYFHQFDIFIPKLNLAIECDGEYWHSKQKDVERDNEINKESFKRDISLLRLSGTEITNGVFKDRFEHELGMKNYETGHNEIKM